MYTDPKKMAARMSQNMTALPMPTPEELDAEAVELETRAGTKERIASEPWLSQVGRRLLLEDAGYFREEAASKRAKAERMRKTVTE